MATRSIRTADVGERSSALRRARVNTFFVRVMRWSLPVAAIGLLSSYALFMQRTIRFEAGNHVGQISVGTMSGTSFENFTMTNPSYEGYNKKDGSRYKVSARKAITDLSRDKPIKLEEIDGAFEQRNGNRTEIKAKRGVFDQNKGELTLDGGIRVAAPNDMVVALSRAVVDTNNAKIVSDQSVRVRMPTGEVRGNAMRLDQRAREVLFHKGVSARLMAGQRQGTDAVADKKGGGGSLLGFNDGASNAPVDITSVSLAVKQQQRTASFTGDVRAIQGGRMLEAPEMVVWFYGSAALTGPAEGSDAATAAAATSGRVRRITAGDGVRLNEGSSTIRALKAVFDAESNEAQFSGGVKISGDDGRVISARLAAVDTVSRRVVLTGKVVATQTDTVMRGNRMIYEPNKGRVSLASPAIAGAPRGDIFVRFKPPARRAGGRRSAAGNGGFTTNPDSPIEITARSLDVEDLNSVARFSGGVRARQGELVLTTPVLTAHYDGRIGLFAPAHGKAGRQPAMRLRVIRASSSVTVTSGNDTRATGKAGEFDLAGDKVTLVGDVVLKQGRQVVRGDRLVIDLKTGLTRMLQAPSASNTAKPLTFGSAAQFIANPGRRSNGRGSLIFYPREAKRLRAERKARGAAAASTKRRAPRLDSGWSSSTTTN